jgi:hypothetical protein
MVNSIDQRIAISHRQAATILHELLLMLFSSADFDVFQGTETHPQSATCKCGTRDARGKQSASPGTFGTEIKPTPFRAAARGAAFFI